MFRIFSSQPPVGAPPFEAFLADLAAIGVRPTASDGDAFSIMAARTNPRWWLIPRSCGTSCARTAFEMFQPINQSARIAKLAAKLAATFEPSGSSAQSMLHLAGAPDFLTAFGLSEACCAYFTGTDGPHRKTAAQIMTLQGKIVGYAKVTRDPKVRHYLENEARTLTELEKLDLTTAMTPRVHKYHDGEEVAWLATDCFDGKKGDVPLEFGPAQAAFLHEMRQRSQESRSPRFLQTMDHQTNLLTPRLDPAWDLRFRTGLSLLNANADMVQVCFAHGDFTPWNSFEVDRRLYVFDWEYASELHPVGYDHLHFLLAVRRGRSVAETIAWTENEISGAWFDYGLTLARLSILASLLHHAAFYMQRSMMNDDDVLAFSDCQYRGELIDCMLERLKN